jgi:hypothetical protein
MLTMCPQVVYILLPACFALVVLAGEPLQSRLCGRLLEGAAQMEPAEAAEVLAAVLTGACAHVVGGTLCAYMHYVFVCDGKRVCVCVRACVMVHTHVS